MNSKLLGTIAFVFALTVAPLSSHGQGMSDAFKDVDRMHWAYNAAEQLRVHGVVSWYPSTYFNRSVLLTRYEFAVLLEQVLHKYYSDVTKPFDESKLTIYEKISNDDITQLSRLFSEFRQELKGIDNHDEVYEKIVAALKSRVQGKTVILNTPDLTGIKLNVPRATLDISPAKSLSINSGFTPPTFNRTNTNSAFNRTSSVLQVGTLARITLGQLGDSASAPFNYKGEAVTNTTNYVHGISTEVNIGSLGLEASFSKQSVLERQLSAPFGLWEAGSTFGTDSLFSNINQFTSFSAGIGSPGSAGHIRLTAVEGSTSSNSNPNLAATALVLGTDAHLRTNALSLSADWRTSSVGLLKTVTAPATTDYSSSFNGAIGINVGSVALSAGYRYVDPLFYSPGYWDRIGSWINPTNIQGPTVRANVDITNGVGLNFGGDFLSGARDRSSFGGLSTNDDLNRVLVGVRWDVAKNFRTTLDWEGVYWKLDPNRVASTSASSSLRPSERYITLGTGYNLSNSTLFKLNYTFGDPGNRNATILGQTNTFNSLSGQLSIKF